MRIAATVAILAILQQTGCDNQPKPMPIVPAKPRPPIHRFVLTRFPADSGVAFDTQTGQICRTWEWQPSGKAADADPNTGGVPQRRVGEFAPTCITIYEKYPGGPGDGVLVEDQQALDK